MHPELLKEIVALCQRRKEQGDHPTEPIADAEVLENAIVQLAAERERLCAEIATLQTVWEDTRTQRDELMAHIKDGASLPEWAAKWLAVCKA